jgi:hypothetical protein
VEGREMEKLSGLSHLFVTVFLSTFANFTVIPAITDVTMLAVCPGRDECSLAIYLTGSQQAVRTGSSSSSSSSSSHAFHFFQQFSSSNLQYFFLLLLLMLFIFSNNFLPQTLQYFFFFFLG